MWQKPPFGSHCVSSVNNLARMRRWGGTNFGAWGTVRTLVHCHQKHRYMLRPAKLSHCQRFASDEAFPLRKPFLLKQQSSLYDDFRLDDEVPFKPLHDLDSCDQLQSGEVQEWETRVAGRITSRRNASKKLVFMDVCQNETMLQIVFSMKRFEKSETFKDFMAGLRRGDIIEVIGALGKTKTGERSLFASSVRVVAPCLHDIPDRISDHEILVKERHLALLTSKELRERLRLRAATIKAIRGFLDERGFIEVETPVLSARVGGAAALPFETEAKALQKEKMYLRIAPELYLKQLVIGGLEQVYEIGKQFRNEGLDATHQPEFTTLEFYKAYGDYESLLCLIETFLQDVVTKVNNGSCTLTTGDGKHAINFQGPFRRLNVTEVVINQLTIVRSKFVVSCSRLWKRDWVPNYHTPFVKQMHALHNFANFARHTTLPQPLHTRLQSCLIA
eukprot:m.23907 g.23907  ORF g.23907 m.23907 type:complete len:447 (+) comp7554_c0_seq3:308-1648(+)